MECLKNFYANNQIEVGCDEAGRGCLAGDVFAAAVIWPRDLDIPEINDSKKINAQKRNELRKIIEKNAIAWAVATCSVAEIDQWNILNASILAMHRSLDQISHPFDFILVDGNRFKPYNYIPHLTVVKGDGKFTAIAAASILAKTHRDAYMKKLAEQYPEYQLAKHKGYATETHRNIIKELGYSDIHRKSFKLKSLL